MRGVIIKAKSKDDGKWVEGYYVKLNWAADDLHVIIPENTEMYSGNVIDIIIEIDPDTICTMEYDGWIPVTERLPEEEKPVLVQFDRYDKYLDMTLKYMDVMSLYDGDEKVFTSINRIPAGEIVAWRPLPEPYRQERSDNHDRE